GGLTALSPRPVLGGEGRRGGLAMTWTRRSFLSRSSLLLLGAAGTTLAAPGDTQDSLPDGSASRGMITSDTEQAIEHGLAYLRSQQTDGWFGTGPYRGNVAVTSLAALAFMAGGNQVGRGPYGRNVTEALKYVLAQEDRNRTGFLHTAGASNTHGPM